MDGNGNGAGSGLNQLNAPHCIFVDEEQSAYVSDRNNHCVMKWVKCETRRIVVVGRNGQENDLTKLHHP
jgi:hypothetical protein